MTAAEERPQEPALPEELGGLLDEIAREPAPEKLLELAMRLQEALRKQRAASSGRIDSEA
ncbi:MAG: hypothetical protein ACK4U0_13050 [Mesorhizobium sp.]